MDGILHDLHIQFGIEIILTGWKALCQMDLSMQMKLYFHYHLQSIMSFVEYKVLSILFNAEPAPSGMAYLKLCKHNVWLTQLYIKNFIGNTKR